MPFSVALGLLSSVARTLPLRRISARHWNNHIQDRKGVVTKEMATTRLDTELRWPGSMQESARALLHRTSNWTRARHSDHKFSNAPCKQAVDLRGIGWTRESCGVPFRTTRRYVHARGTRSLRWCWLALGRPVEMSRAPQQRCIRICTDECLSDESR